MSQRPSEARSVCINANLRGEDDCRCCDYWRKQRVNEARPYRSEDEPVVVVRGTFEPNAELIRESFEKMDAEQRARFVEANPMRFEGTAVNFTTPAARMQEASRKPPGALTQRIRTQQGHHHPACAHSPEHWETFCAECLRNEEVPLSEHWTDAIIKRWDLNDEHAIAALKHARKMGEVAVRSAPRTSDARSDNLMAHALRNISANTTDVVSRNVAENALAECGHKGAANHRTDKARSERECDMAGCGDPKCNRARCLVARTEKAEALLEELKALGLEMVTEQFGSPANGPIPLGQVTWLRLAKLVGWEQRVETASPKEGATDK